jgi:hypothetical protein
MTAILMNLYAVGVRAPPEHTDTITDLELAGSRTQSRDYTCTFEADRILVVRDDTHNYGDVFKVYTAGFNLDFDMGGLNRYLADSGFTPRQAIESSKKFCAELYLCFVAVERFEDGFEAFCLGTFEGVDWFVGSTRWMCRMPSRSIYCISLGSPVANLLRT